MLLLVTTLLLLISLAQADHSVCGWTGPGPGDPAKYGFKQYCMATRVDVIEFGDSKPSWAKFLCDGWRIADWNQLRASILELRTPCNGDGFVRESKGDCSIQNWGYCLTNSTDMKAPICLYITEYNDCEWPGTFTLDSLPLKMGVYSKRDEIPPPTAVVGAREAGRIRSSRQDGRRERAAGREQSEGKGETTSRG